MLHPEADTCSPGPYWGKKEYNASMHVPLMIGTEVSHSPRIPTSTSNLVSYVQADGNGNMSLALTG